MTIKATRAVPTSPPKAARTTRTAGGEERFGHAGHGLIPSRRRRCRPGCTELARAAIAASCSAFSGGANRVPLCRGTYGQSPTARAAVLMDGYAPSQAALEGSITCSCRTAIGQPTPGGHPHGIRLSRRSRT